MKSVKDTITCGDCIDEEDANGTNTLSPDMLPENGNNARAEETGRPVTPQEPSQKGTQQLEECETDQVTNSADHGENVERASGALSDGDLEGVERTPSGRRTPHKA